MNTDKTSSTQEEYYFILGFVHWLNCNFAMTEIDKYRDVKSLELYTPAECLDLYRKQQIPPLPEMSSNLGGKTITTTEEFARRNRIMFTGYQKIQTLLLQPLTYDLKRELYSIIAETFLSISHAPNP